MPRKFKPGESGNPNGSTVRNSVVDVIRQVAMEKIEHPKGETDELGNVKKIRRLRAAAEAAWDKACSGDIQAFKELTERLAGKVPNVNVEVPVKPLDEMTHDELVTAILGSQDDGGTQEDSALSRATPAGHA